jgi:hypothetical protein
MGSSTVNQIFFLSFEGRFADLYEEDRKLFKSETNLYSRVMIS